jgi:hypothetical protein
MLHLLLGSFLLCLNGRPRILDNHPHVLGQHLAGVTILTQVLVVVEPPPLHGIRQPKQPTSALRYKQRWSTSANILILRHLSVGLDLGQLFKRVEEPYRPLLGRQTLVAPTIERGLPLAIEQRPGDEVGAQDLWHLWPVGADVGDLGLLLRGAPGRSVGRGRLGGGCGGGGGGGELVGARRCAICVFDARRL